MPPVRDSSPGPASSSKMTQYSKTGRPIRRSAGKAKPLAGYVDSKVIEEDAEEPIDTPSEDEDGELIKPQRKRKRTPSLSPPPLSPIIRDQERDLPSDDDVQNTPITLQFNIPLGFHGPFVVKLDQSVLTQVPEGAVYEPHSRQIRRKLITKPVPEKTEERKGKGFEGLPAELRNKIYRNLFVTGHLISISRATNLSRSGQFLRTCKLIHSEGCSVLYGENTVILDRSRDRRGPFWEPQPKEIGYTDSRRFLTIIGPDNLAYLRDVKLILEDACPSSTPYLSHEDRRFVNDGHLIDILRILRGTQLRDFTLTFLGRRTLVRTDTKILGYLEQIKADFVSSKAPYSSNGWYSPKVSMSLWLELKQAMTRTKKLYSKA